MKEIAEAGECLIRRRFRRLSDTSILPLEIQILESDYIDTLKDGYVANGTNSLIQGVEINKVGRKVAYHLYTEHPNDAPLFGASLDSTRVAAKEIIHLLRIDRAGQVRGIPWLAPVMVKMRDFDEYEDAQLIRQKIAACFAGFIHDSDPSAVSNGATKSDVEDFYSKRITPANFEILPPGKSIEFTKPPEVTGYDEYTKVVLRSIAAGLGVTYESLTGDLSNVNFSSGRMGWIEFQRSLVSWRETIMINNFCYRIFEWFKEAAYFVGLDAEKDGVSMEWKPPRREMIDPTREIPAIRDAIRSGLLSYKTAVLEMGYDPQVLLAEISEYNELIDNKDIILDSDPRRTNISGSAQRIVVDDPKN
jgi:lambda family phage portal protein